jgi:hypothetical protein
MGVSHAYLSIQRYRLWAAVVLVIAWSLGTTGAARAQTRSSPVGAAPEPNDASASHPRPPQPGDADLEAARELFLQAEKEEDDGNWQSALDKLRGVAGMRLTAGVRYHIALCQEHLGLIAAALVSYTQAASQAHEEDARDVLRLVGKRVAALEPRVPRLSVRVNPDTPNAVVTLDGSPLETASLGEPIPVEPGSHELLARAPGHAPAKAIVTMHEHDSMVLDLNLEAVKPGPILPSSAPEPVRASAPSAATHSARAGHGHVSAMLWTTASVVLAAGGAAAYVLADRAVDEGAASCRTRVSTSPDACSSERFAIRAWDATAAAAWTGALVASVFAVVLWATPERKTSSEPSVRLVTGPTAILAEGRF